MGVYSDYLDQSEPTAPEAPTSDTVGASLRKGWNSGMAGAGSQFNSLAGLAGEAAGMDDFAAARRADSLRLREEAAQAAPQVQSYKDVDGLRSGLNYAAGLIGGSAPISLGAIGAGALTGGSALPAIGAATAFIAPFEMGDVVQKQEADPQAMQQDAGGRLTDAFLGGGASALAQGVVPGVIGGKIVARGATGAAKKSAGKVLRDYVLGAAALEGVAEGGGDAIKQFAANQDQPLDWELIKENAVGGAVAGGAMGTIGAGADLAYRVAPQAANALGEAGQYAKGVMGDAKAKADAGVAKAADSGAGKKVRSVYDDASDALTRGMQASKDTVGKVLRGEEAFVDLKEAATASRERMSEILKDSDGKTVEVVKAWGKEMLDKLKPEDPRYAKVVEAMQDTTSRAGQQAMAKMKQAWDATGHARKRANDFADAVKEEYADFKKRPVDVESRVVDEPNDAQARLGLTEEAPAAPKRPTINERKAFIKARMDEGMNEDAAREAFMKSLNEPKKSEDTSGTVRAVQQALVESGLAERRPELFADNETINAVADGLRVVIEEMAKGQLKPKTAAQLTKLLGDDAEGVMRNLQVAIMEDLPAGQAETFLKNLNMVADNRKQENTFHENLRQLMTPESQAMGTYEMPNLGDLLMRHARGELEGRDKPPTEQQKADLRAIHALYAHHFGDNADTAYKLVEKQYAETNRVGKDSTEKAPLESDEVFDDEGNRLEEAPTDVMKFGLSKTTAAQDGKRKFQLGGIPYGKTGRYAKENARYANQHLKDLKAKYPDSDVRMDEDGFIVVENRDNPGEFNDADLADMKLDTKKYPKSKSRIEAGGHILDASRIAMRFQAKARKDFSPDAKPHPVASLKDAFAQGIAQLSVQFDTPITPTDEMVIGFRGGNPLTWGQARKADTRTSEDANADYEREALHNLRMTYKQAKAAGATKDQLAEIMSDAREITAQMTFVKNRELGQEDNGQNARGTHARRVREHVAFMELKAASLGRTLSKTERAVANRAEGINETYDKRFNSEGTLTRAGLAELLAGDTDGFIDVGAPTRSLHERDRKEVDNGQGRTAVGKDENIHLAAVAHKGEDLVVRSNMDGSPRYATSTQAEVDPGAVENIVRWGRSDVEAQKKLSQRGRVLLGAVSMMSAADVRKLNGIPEKASEAAATINELARKYAGQIMAPEVVPPKIDPRRMEGSPDPKAVAAKKAALLKKAASGDTGLLKELAASTDAKGLQRALGAVLESRVMTAGELRATGGQSPVLVAAQNASNAMAKALIDGGAKTVQALHDAARPFTLEILTERMRNPGDRNVAMALGLVRNSVDQFTAAFGMDKTNAALRESLKDEDRPLGELMAIVGASDAKPALKIVADAVAMVAPNTNVTVGELAPGNFGTFAPSRKLITLSEATLDTGAVATLVHEGVHAATVDGVTRDPELHAALYELMDHVTRTRPDIVTAYGMKSTLEFLAEGLSNPGFQKALSEVKASPEVQSYLKVKLDNMWQAFVALMGKALGLDPKDNSALHQLLDLGAVAMQRTEASTTAITREEQVAFEARPLVSKADATKILNRLQPLFDGDKDMMEALNALASEQGISHGVAEILMSLDPSVGASSASERMGLFESIARVMAHPAGLGVMANRAENVINARLSELVQDPAVAYSLQTTNPNTSNTSANNPEVGKYVEKVLGKSVKLAWAKFTHAGEFARLATGDVIRLSIHALDPLSTAHHEALHAFFAQLKDVGATDITDVLAKAAASPQVIAQLEALYANQPAVLRQLKDPEERAAYMYQMWAADPKGFKASIAARTVFQKIAAFTRRVLGIWSNDERAMEIMAYFHDGKYAANIGNPSAVRQAVMAPGRNAAVDAVGKITEPLSNLADSVVGTGGGRLRDTGVPSLVRLADLIKRDQFAEAGKVGFISAARIEATKMRTRLGEDLEGFTEAQLREAMEALQAVRSAASVEAQAAADKIKTFLRDTRSYMKAAGVDIGDLGPDYFPRVWDTHYISKNQQAFKDMLEPYIRSGEMQGTAEQLIKNFTAREGNEFGIETRTPGMQFKKSRVLDFITAADAAPFMSKDLYGTLNSYLIQASRRAEWDRRFGWDANAKDTKLSMLLQSAVKEGATPEQMQLTDQYLKGVDGTLGDSINPHARRIMGNMIVYQNIRLLPMAMFSMAVDPVGVMVRGGSLKDAYATFKRGVASIPETYGRRARHDESERLAEMIGVVDTAMMSSVMSDIYTQGMVGGTAQKLNNTFFKYNMVEGLNRSFRVGASEAAMRFIARHADLTASRHSKRWMKELSLEQGDVIRVGNRIALTEAEGLTARQVERVHAAVNMWVDGAMLRPDAADKPIWMNDPHFALLAHLKQFVFAFQKTILSRVAHEFKQGNYAPGMALAFYVPVMLASDTIKGLLQGGGDTPEWKKGWGPAEYTGYAMERAGLFGVGQFGLDAAQDVEYGGLGPMGVAGPTIEQFVDAVNVLGGSKQFGPVLLDSLPANALYKGLAGGAATPGPTFSN